MTGNSLEKERETPVQLGLDAVLAVAMGSLLLSMVFEPGTIAVAAPFLIGSLVAVLVFLSRWSGDS